MGSTYSGMPIFVAACKPMLAESGAEEGSPGRTETSLWSPLALLTPKGRWSTDWVTMGRFGVKLERLGFAICSNQTKKALRASKVGSIGV